MSTSVIEESDDFEYDVNQREREIERLVEQEQQRKRDYANRINMFEAQIAELWDRVDKARRRESDISYRVTSLAHQLTEQMGKTKNRRAKLDNTVNTSSQLSAAIMNDLEKLAEKRENVERMRREIDIRRKLHRKQLKMEMAEISMQENDINEWKSISASVEQSVELLKKRRDELMETVEKQLEQETTEKKKLEQLEMMLNSTTPFVRTTNDRFFAAGDMSSQSVSSLMSMNE